jgi:hypothetical protein
MEIDAQNAVLRPHAIQHQIVNNLARTFPEDFTAASQSGMSAITHVFHIHNSS